MPQVKIDHSVITVSDWTRSNAFYAAVLGAELVRFDKGWAYRLGQVQLNVHGPGVPGDPNARLPVPRVGARGHGTSAYFRDPDGSLLEFISYADTKVPG